MHKKTDSGCMNRSLQAHVRMLTELAARLAVLLLHVFCTPACP